jgi:hypothetical protein
MVDNAGECRELAVGNTDYLCQGALVKISIKEVDKKTVKENGKFVEK